MSLVLRQNEPEPFQDETPELEGATPASPAETVDLAEGFDPTPALPAPEKEASDRRGPLRPEGLTTTRSRLNGWTLGMIFRVADGAAIAAVSLLLRALLISVGANLSLLAIPIVTVLLVWSLSAVDAYRFHQRESFGRHLVRVAAGFGVASLVLIAGTVLMQPAEGRSVALGLWLCSNFVVVYGLHALWKARVQGWRRAGRLTPNIVVVGATENAERLIASAMRTRDAAVLGIFDDRADRAPPTIRGVPVLGDTNALLSHRIMPYVDRVVITVSAKAQTRVRQLIETLGVLPNEVMLFLDDSSPEERENTLSRIADMPLTRVSGEPGNDRRALVKRMQDLVVGALALVLGAPIMLAVAIAIRLDSPGPILFRQRRHGFNNEEIVVWKFRSMKVEDTDHKAARQVSAGDDRVTRVGRFIRKTSLDELPQIINVLSGEMSLVGPRPHAVGMKTGETESALLVAKYAHRHRMKPGMTGWAAIQGSRGPVDTPELVHRRVALDVEYIERQSFWLDLYIMAMTIPCLLGDAKSVR